MADEFEPVHSVDEYYDGPRAGIAEYLRSVESAFPPKAFELASSQWYHIDMLGFEKRWHEGDGTGKVCQVNRGECEIILCEDATRRDKARLFVELTLDGLAEFRRELVERSVPSNNSAWGYDVIQIHDPDGNEMLFPLSESSKQ